MLQSLPRKVYPGPCQELCSEELKLFPISCRTMSLWSWHPNFIKIRLILGIIYLLNSLNFHDFLETPNMSEGKRICNIYHTKIVKSLLHVNYKTFKHFGEKRDWHRLFCDQMEIDIMISLLYVLYHESICSCNIY